jgi:hypothetical protein
MPIGKPSTVNPVSQGYVSDCTNVYGVLSGGYRSQMSACQNCNATRHADCSPLREIQALSTASCSEIGAPQKCIPYKEQQNPPYDEDTDEMISGGGSSGGGGGSGGGIGGFGTGKDGHGIFKPGDQSPQPEKSGFWNKTKIHILLGIIAAVLLLVLIFVLYKRSKGSKVSASFHRRRR